MDALVGALALAGLSALILAALAWVLTRRGRYEDRLSRVVEEDDLSVSVDAFGANPGLGLGPLGSSGGDAANLGDEKSRFSVANTAFATRLDRGLRRGRLGAPALARLGRANLRFTILEFYMLKALGALLGVTLGLYLGRGGWTQAILFAVGIGSLGFLTPNLYAKLRTAQRLRAFNVQLAEAVGLLANAMRSGYSLVQSLELVSKEQPDPLGSEFRRVALEVKLGVGPNEAMMNLYNRVPSDDLDLMITSINIQSEVGGNLALMLDTIAHTIRERVRMKGEIGVLTAQGRISGYMVSAIPVVLGVLISVINPGYMNALWAWPVVLLPGCGFLLWVIGVLVIRRITNIQV